MSKRHLYSTLAATALLMLSYQNCGKPFGMKALSSEGDSKTLVFTEPTPPPTPPPTPEPPAHVAVVEKATFVAPLADRKFVHSLLKDVFGPTAETVDTATEKIFSSASQFGGLCSIYENYLVPNAVATKAPVAGKPFDPCAVNTASTALGAPAPSPHVIRQAMLLKTCTALVSNTTTLGFALKKISTEAVPAATKENLQKLFGLFYRDKPEAPDDLLESLGAMMDSSTLTAQSWAAPIYTVCVSSHWQTL